MTKADNLAYGLMIAAAVAMVGGFYWRARTWHFYSDLGYSYHEIVEKAFYPEMIINLAAVSVGLSFVVFGANRDKLNIPGALQLCIGFLFIIDGLASIAAMFR